MKNDRNVSNALFILAYIAAVLLVTCVAYAWVCAAARDVKPSETVCARVSAPEDVPERDFRTVREEQIANVIAAVPETVAVNVYDHLDSAPLRTEVQMMIEDVCAARGVDVRVVLAIIEVESGFNESAIGDRCQSYGLMQAQPRWHSERMARLGVTDLLDGVQNALVGVDYLDELLDRYGGDYGAALTAYNQGHYYGEVSRYANKVMAIAGKEIS